MPCLALLSIKASTASCNILFSLRVIISGAFNSRSCFKRLFRLMTRRYKSFKSEVAKRPPSKGTIGLKSGGITGTTFKIIHSGLILFLMRWLKNLILLINRSLLAPVDFSKSLSSSAMVLVMSILAKRFLMASAPISASKTWPYFNDKSWKACSEIIFSGFNSLSSVSAVFKVFSNSLNFSSFWAVNLLICPSIISPLAEAGKPLALSCLRRLSKSLSICLRYCLYSTLSCTKVSAFKDSLTLVIIKSAK